MPGARGAVPAGLGGAVARMTDVPFYRRIAPGWLAGAGAEGFAAALEAARGRIAASGGGRCRVVVRESVSVKFLAAWLAGMEAGATVFLADPAWRDTACAEASGLIGSAVTFGESMGAANVYPEVGYSDDFSGKVMIPTGGTGGRVKFAIHDAATLGDSAQALSAWLGGGALCSLCVLPLHHVSGLMQAVRALETGGQLRLEPWKGIETGRLPVLPPGDWLLSLVPTQLRRLLSRTEGSAWLRQFRAVFLGGAAADAALLEQARQARVPVAPCYGMTETAAMVAAQRPEAFLAGEPLALGALPPARFSVRDAAGKACAPGERGRIEIETAALSLGYFPARPARQAVLSTEDEGSLDTEGRLVVHGRLDRLIITGGEKVDPRAVEEVVKAAGIARECLVVGEPDASWGMRVVAIYVSADSPPAAPEALRERLRGRVAPALIPRRWIPVERLPLDEKGKVDPMALAAVLRA